MMTPIGSKPSPAVTPVASGAASATDRVATAVATVAGSPRPARLSDEVRALLSAPPPIDMARVERLRAAIAEGSYRVEPDRIAAAMIADDLSGGTPA